MIVRTDRGSLLLSLHIPFKGQDLARWELFSRAVDRKRGKCWDAGNKDGRAGLVESGTRSREQFDGG